MTVGTKSLLFGVHAFWFHPIVVARAWRHVHKRGPDLLETICILVHDWGYWGCPNMDGEQGRKHPEKGATLARRIVNALGGDGDAAYELTLLHSSNYARTHGANPSALYLPDKLSIAMEPGWFYRLRARLSGEIWEYIKNSPLANLPPALKTPKAWYCWYLRTVKEKAKEKLCGH